MTVIILSLYPLHRKINKNGNVLEISAVIINVEVECKIREKMFDVSTHRPECLLLLRTRHLDHKTSTSVQRYPG